MSELARAPENPAGPSPYSTGQTRRAGALGSLGSAGRFVLRKLLWLVISALQQMWRHPLLTLALLVAVALGYTQYQHRQESGTPPAEADFEIAAALPPAASVQRYLDAQRNLDAGALWDQYTDGYKTYRLNRGETLQTIQSNFDDLAEQGASFGESVYLGGHPTDSGATRYIYMTPLSSPGQGVQATLQVLYVDSSGLISNVAVVIEHPTPPE
jgi:hypothetical protein